MNSFYSRFNYNPSNNIRIGVRLSSTNSYHGKVNPKDALINQLSNADPYSLWIFLATHGLWLEKFDKSTYRPLVLIDPLTGVRRLKISYKYYELISAILLVPLFDMYVEEVSYVKDEGKDSEYKPWGIHSKVKRGEILDTGIECQRVVQVTPLTFYAITCGYHRIGYSHRLAALQTAITEKILEAYFQSTVSDITYPQLYNVSMEQEFVGALVSLLSLVVRYNEIDTSILKAEMTTSINPIGKLDISEKRCLASFARSFLCKIAEKMPDIKIDLMYEKTSDDPRKMFSLSFQDEELDCLFNVINEKLKLLGRLSYLQYLSRKFEEEYAREDVRNILLDFSEQMNPCDVYILSTLVKRNLGEKLHSTWIICTPLTYPLAALSTVYAAHLSALGDVRIVMSSEDPAIAKTLASKISEKEEIKNNKSLYLAAGPTSHVACFSKTLKKGLGDKIILETIAP